MKLKITYRLNLSCGLSPVSWQQEAGYLEIYLENVLIRKKCCDVKFYFSSDVDNDVILLSEQK